MQVRAHLRKALGNEVLLTRSAVTLLATTPGQVDVRAVEAMVADGRHAPRRF